MYVFILEIELMEKREKILVTDKLRITTELTFLIILLNIYFILFQDRV